MVGVSKVVRTSVLLVLKEGSGVPGVTVAKTVTVTKAGGVRFLNGLLTVTVNITITMTMTVIVEITVPISSSRPLAILITLTVTLGIMATMRRSNQRSDAPLAIMAIVNLIVAVTMTVGTWSQRVDVVPWLS